MLPCSASRSFRCVVRPAERGRVTCDPSRLGLLDARVEIDHLVPIIAQVIALKKCGVEQHDRVARGRCPLPDRLIGLQVVHTGGVFVRPACSTRRSMVAPSPTAADSKMELDGAGEAPGGALAEPGMSLVWSGGGCVVCWGEGDFLAGEAFEFVAQGSGAALRVESVVPVGSEVVEALVGFGEQVPANGELGIADRNEGFAFAAASGDAAVACAKEAGSAAGADGGLAEGAGQPGISFAGGAAGLLAG